jgi:magnesium-transporting ATPase (P-type)
MPGVTLFSAISIVLNVCVLAGNIFLLSRLIKKIKRFRKDIVMTMLLQIFSLVTQSITITYIVSDDLQLSSRLLTWAGILCTLMVFFVVQTDLYVLEIFKGLNEKITSRRIQIARVIFLMFYLLTCSGLLIVGFVSDASASFRSISLVGAIVWVGSCTLYDNCQIYFLLYQIRASNRNPDKKTISQEFHKVRPLILLSIVFDWVGIAAIVFFALMGMITSTTTGMPIPMASAGVHAIMAALIFEKVQHLPFAGRIKRKQADAIHSVAPQSVTLPKTEIL